MHIILNHPHTHAGQPLDAGAELDVSQRDAEWLVSTGIANFKPGVHKPAAPQPAAVSDSQPADESVGFGSRIASLFHADHTGDTP